MRAHQDEVRQCELGAWVQEFTADLDGMKSRGHYIGIGKKPSQRAGIMAPVFQGDKRIFGALTVTSPMSRMATISQEKTVTLLLSASSRIEPGALLVQTKRCDESARIDAVD